MGVAHAEIDGEETAPLATSEIPSLAPRELDVLRLMAGEGSYSDIVRNLGLQPDTVKSYAKAIRRKFGGL